MKLPSLRVGLGYDIHRTASDRKLILGGIEIAGEFGLEGHSDADVLLHAITDALIGAMGKGDIGEYFPDTDPAYKGACSQTLLAKIVQEAKQEGWAIVNVDCNILAEKPKLQSYKRQIRDNVAQCLNIDKQRVNIKAKTNEKLDAVGRVEGMAAQAVVLLTREETS